MNKIILFCGAILMSQLLFAQSEIEQITATLKNYMVGSTQGQPELLKQAFHPKLNLYYVRKDTLRVWPGTEYIKSTKEGEPTGETTKIISIDYENDAACAKVEVYQPERKTAYVDYFLLLKIKDEWKIINKSFTKRIHPKK